MGLYPKRGDFYKKIKMERLSPLHLFIKFIHTTVPVFVAGPPMRAVSISTVSA